MATSLQSLPPSSCCFLCYVRLWVLFFSWHPAPDFIALNTSCNHFIFLPSSCPPTPPSIFKTNLPCVQLCSGRPPATQTGRISSLKTHSLVIINNFTVFYEVIDHWCAHPSPTVGSMMEAWSSLFTTVSFLPVYSRCSKKKKKLLLIEFNYSQIPQGVKGIIFVCCFRFWKVREDIFGRCTGISSIPGHWPWTWRCGRDSRFWSWKQSDCHRVPGCTHSGEGEMHGPSSSPSPLEEKVWFFF